MPNPFNSEVSQVMKSGGKGPKDQRTTASMPSLSMRSAPWPGLPGSTGPGRNTMGVRKVKDQTQTKGL